MKNSSNASEIQKRIESRLSDSFNQKSSNGGNSLYIFNEDNIIAILGEKGKGIKSYQGLKDRGLEKGYRGKMRRILESFRNDLLGKDRSMEERLNAMKSFKSHFEKFYASSALESFNDIYQGNDESKIKIHSQMINQIKDLQMIGKSKK
jgi:hypothetical protein